METSIIVAIIAGFASFVGLVITKEQKVSEFRQAWIDALRSDVSELMSAINHFELAYLTYRKQNAGRLAHDFIDENVEITNKIQLMIHRINLRINPKDSEGVIEEINKLSDILISPYEMLKDNALENATKTFNDKIHVVLKNEWERVKKGEPWFKFTKWGIIILFVGFVCFIGCTKLMNSEKDTSKVKLNLEMTISDKKAIDINESNTSIN